MRDKLNEKNVNYWTWKNTNKLVAFHGSVCSVTQPLIERSVHNSELGKGFYCFTDPMFAYKHRGRFSKAVINMYIVDVNKLVDDKACLFSANDSTIELYESISGFNDVMFKYCCGASIFTKLAGGQYFTEYQEILDEYFEYVGAYKLQDIYVLFCFDLGNKAVLLNDRNTFMNINRFKQSLVNGVVRTGMCDEKHAVANVNSIPNTMLETRMKEMKEMWDRLDSL